MASQPSAKGSGPSGPSAKSSTTNDPILRNALRYTVSAREYAALHKYILSRSRVVRRNVPSVEKVNRIMNGAPAEGAGKNKGKGKDKDQNKDEGKTTAAAIVGADDFNARAVRHALRVFLGTAAGMKLYTVVLERLARRGKEYVIIEFLPPGSPLRMVLRHMLTTFPLGHPRPNRRRPSTNHPPSAYLSPSRQSCSFTACYSASSRVFAPTSSTHPHYPFDSATPAPQMPSHRPTPPPSAPPWPALRWASTPRSNCVCPSRCSRSSALSSSDGTLPRTLAHYGEGIRVGGRGRGRGGGEVGC